MPLEIRNDQVSFIRSMLFTQEMSDEIASKDNISDEELVKTSKAALGNLNLH